MFNNEGLYLCDIGKEELCAGKFLFSKAFTIDAFNNLIVCDKNNNRRFQVFSFDGKFIYSFNIEEIECPSFVAAFEDNKLLVCDYGKHVVHVLQ